MFSRMLTYDGSLDATGKTLTLETEGPSFTDPGKLSKYRDIIEMKDQNTRILRSAMLADDGKWHEFQTATYRRRVP